MPNPYKMSMNMTSNIDKYCSVQRTCRADYSKLKTGGNDPSISRAMRFSQIIRNTQYCKYWNYTVPN